MVLVTTHPSDVTTTRSDGRSTLDKITQSEQLCRQDDTTVRDAWTPSVEGGDYGILLRPQIESGSGGGQLATETTHNRQPTT